MLAGLAAGCGLDFRLADYVPAGARSVDEAVGQLGVGLRELIAQTQAVVGSAPRLNPTPVQGRQHLTGGGLDGPGVLLPAPAARNQRLRRPRGIGFGDILDARSGWYGR